MWEERERVFVDECAVVDEVPEEDEDFADDKVKLLAVEEADEDDRSVELADDFELGVALWVAELESTVTLVVITVVDSSVVP